VRVVKPGGREGLENIHLFEIVLISWKIVKKGEYCSGYPASDNEMGIFL
jgi:hypothetical protein